MSEKDFKMKKEQILHDYSVKIIELQDLISYYNKQKEQIQDSKDKQSENKIKNILEMELNSQNKKLEEEMNSLQATFDKG